MPKIAPESLLTLEAYSRQRRDIRARVLEHKKHRSVAVGEHVTLLFEDELTIRYQVQEMLRAERIFEERGILEELHVYNPLIPDGRNFKATMMLEYPDPQERRIWLARLIGIAQKTWIEVEGCDRVWAVADEDLERDTPEKTSSVHFLRFELTEETAQALKYGVGLSVGIDHANYRASVELDPATRQALLADLA